MSPNSRYLPSRRALLTAAAAATVATAGGVLPSFAAESRRVAATHRTLAFYQTNNAGGSDYISPLPLGGIATDVEVAAFHLNDDGSVHLNDDPPSDPMFDQMWADIRSLQESGIKVQALLGGAGTGSFANLHNDFDRFYGLLRDVLRDFQFDGVDLDIEEPYSTEEAEQLIGQLRTDFGTEFIITMTPVAAALSGGSDPFGGPDYQRLESEIGDQISWYTTQFYCGWGSLDSTGDYDAVVGAGFAPSRVVAGTVTNPDTCGGYVEPDTLASTLRSLVGTYPDFAGAAGWEYFNAVPVGGSGPETWYANLANAMG